ncbi:MAG: hypothetical protein Ct9H300mP14_07000 [Gammaproteobacteria bacterium]|nr:MAG: hypothetical protein Ct9H300mP14_07000 [Gammaproteobacteria bacterium]
MKRKTQSFTEILRRRPPALLKSSYRRILVLSVRHSKMSVSATLWDNSVAVFRINEVIDGTWPIYHCRQAIHLYCMVVGETSLCSPAVETLRCYRYAQGRHSTREAMVSRFAFLLG